MGDGRPVFQESPGRFLESKHGFWELKRDNEPEEIKVVVTRYRGADSDKNKTKNSLGELLLSRMGEGTKDVTIKIDGKVILKAHKSILSATCPAWKNLFSSGMSEDKLGQIDLYRIKPIVLKGFVRSLYTTNAPKETLLLAPVAMMCDQYRCSSLMETCTKALEHAMKSDLKLLQRTVKLVFSLDSSTPIAEALQGAIHGALCHRMPPKEIFCEMFFSRRV